MFPLSQRLLRALDHSSNAFALAQVAPQNRLPLDTRATLSGRCERYAAVRGEVPCCSAAPVSASCKRASCAAQLGDGSIMWSARTSCLGTKVQEEEVSPRTNSVCVVSFKRAIFAKRVPATGCSSSTTDRDLENVFVERKVNAWICAPTHHRQCSCTR